MERRDLCKPLVALLATTLCCCQPAFEDDTQSLLRKLEILSVVLDPPEAAPGQRVTCSFLVADERGVVNPPKSLWLPFDPSALAAGAKPGQQEGADPASLQGERFSLVVGQSYAFDAHGVARQPLSLVIQTEPLPSEIETPEQLISNLAQLQQSGAVKMATRTLVVSTRDSRSDNPAVERISAVTGDEEITLSLARSSDGDLSATRRAAADDPLLVHGGASVTFKAVSEDAARFQWISTAGDFESRRQSEQAWTAPDYQPAEEDQRGKTGVDPRSDPNLYPVWLIIRDGGELALGQSWAELYIRIIS